jgi:hypothetical protein
MYGRRILIYKKNKRLNLTQAKTMRMTKLYKGSEIISFMIKIKLIQN